MRAGALALAVGLFGCAGPTPAPPLTHHPLPGDSAAPDDPPAGAAFAGAPLDARGLLRRASLDLRGVVPTEAELDAVEADPSAVEGLIRGFLDDPRYEERLVDLLAERFLTRGEEFNLRWFEMGLDPEQDFAFRRAVGEEPLRVMARVAVEGRPWTDTVTTELTVANELLREIWPIEAVEEGAGWRWGRYTDGRPAGGALMTNGLWWRYYTTPNNFSRSRASALSRLFLCEDFLTRPISFESLALLDRESQNEAIQTVPACVGCHSTLDPLAASLFGFWWFDIYAPAELNVYHPEREMLGPYYLETEMAWFGAPMADAADLGPFVADDPRFRSCAVKSLAAALWRRTPDLADFDTLQALQVEFEASGLRHKALAAAILQGDDYRVGALAPGASEADAARLTTRRLLSPEQLASAVEGLTGFRWAHRGYDQLTNDVVGYRILGGGMDGQSVTRPERDPTLTHALVVQRLAQAAGQAVVADELVAAGERRLFPAGLRLTDRPGDAAFDDALGRVHRRVFGRWPTDPEAQEAAAFWEGVAAANGPDAAWASLVAVFLRDPAFWTH